MKYIEITHIRVHAVPGSEFGECLQEAIKLAIIEWKNVLLIHDRKEYRINVNNLIGAVVKRSTEIKEEPT